MCAAIHKPRPAKRGAVYGILSFMEPTSRKTMYGVGALIILVLALGWYLGHRGKEAPSSPADTVATTTPETATTTPPAVNEHTTAPVPKPVTSTMVNPIPVDSRDTIASWDIADAAFAKGAKDAEIVSLSAKLGKGSENEYDTYIAIAQDYALTGDGQNAYAYYVKAAEYNFTRGLAFADIGDLMTKLGAVNTAKTAYAKAVKNEPASSYFQLSYLQFLTAHAPNDAETATAFTSAKKSLGAHPDLLIAEAEWYTIIGNKTSAIADWEAVRMQVSPAQQTSIDAKIAKLKAAS